MIEIEGWKIERERIGFIRITAPNGESVAVDRVWINQPHIICQRKDEMKALANFLDALLLAGESGKTTICQQEELF